MTASPKPESEADAGHGLLDGRLHLRQPAEGYRAAIDPIFLAAAVPAVAGQTVLELGFGVGTAGLCLASRVEGVSVTGVELQEDFVDLARRNIEANDFADRVKVWAADIADLPKEIRAETYDHVMMNPPYFEPRSSRASPLPSKALANTENHLGLGDWLEAGIKRLRHRGSITVTHSADRLDDLLSELGERAGSPEVYPLWPKADRPAKRIVVRAVKGGRASLVMHPGLVLHQQDGEYTEAARRILWDAEGLPI